MRRSLLFIAVCTASAWVGFFTAFLMPNLLMKLFLLGSATTVVYAVGEIAIALWQKFDNRLVPNSYYGPTRPTENQAEVLATLTALEQELAELQLQLTEEKIRTGKCKVCGSDHFLLPQYPFLPEFHNPGCPIPELRAEVAEVAQYEESKQQ